MQNTLIRRVAFAVPAGASWPLPLYELALMTGAHVAERGLRKVELSLVSTGHSSSTLREGLRCGSRSGCIDPGHRTQSETARLFKSAHS